MRRERMQRFVTRRRGAGSVRGLPTALGRAPPVARLEQLLFSYSGVLPADSVSSSGDPRGVKFAARCRRTQDAFVVTIGKLLPFLRKVMGFLPPFLDKEGLGEVLLRLHEAPSIPPW